MPFTRGEMVQEAARAGHRVSERLVTDWVGLGLLDHPERTPRGKGKGRGALYLYPDAQKELFLALLGHRSQRTDVASLTTIPVSLWLLWGDQYVRLGQVRRALATWVDGAPGSRSYERARRFARKAVRELAPRGSPPARRRELEEALALAIYNGSFDPSAIAPLVKEIVDPRAGKRYGPFVQTVEEVVDTLGCLLTGMAIHGQAADGAFQEARLRYRQFVLSYRADQPRLAAAFGSWFEEPTLELLINRSCRDLLTHLGLMEIAARQGRPLPPPLLIDWKRPPADLSLK